MSCKTVAIIVNMFIRMLEIWTFKVLSLRNDKSNISFIMRKKKQHFVVTSLGGFKLQGKGILLNRFRSNLKAAVKLSFWCLSCSKRLAIGNHQEGGRVREGVNTYFCQPIHAFLWDMEQSLLFRVRKCFLPIRSLPRPPLESICFLIHS